MVFSICFGCLTLNDDLQNLIGNSAINIELFGLVAIFKKRLFSLIHSYVTRQKPLFHACVVLYTVHSHCTVAGFFSSVRYICPCKRNIVEVCRIFCNILIF